MWVFLPLFDPRNIMATFAKPAKIVWNDKHDLLLFLCQDGNMISEMLSGIFPCDIQGLLIQWNDHNQPWDHISCCDNTCSYPPPLNKIDFCGSENST